VQPPGSRSLETATLIGRRQSSGSITFAFTQFQYVFGSIILNPVFFWKPFRHEVTFVITFIDISLKNNSCVVNFFKWHRGISDGLPVAGARHNLPEGS